MKLKLICTLVALLSLFQLRAQTITGDRGVFRQSLYLRDRWIDSLLNDTTFRGRVKSLPTADAVARYVGAAVQSLDISLDSVLSKGNRSERAATVGQLNTRFIQGDTTSNDPYEIVVFPDIQNMIRLFQPYSRAMFKWVADSATYYNVKGLLQVGDVTDYNTTAEWDTVMNQLSLVTTAHPTLPYLFVAGNHDYGNGFNPAARDASRFNTYMGPAHFAGKPFYGGNYNGSNENYWIKFEAGSKKYMALGLEFLPRDVVVNWASNLLDSMYAAEPDREVMVVTHAYISQIGELATDTSYYSGNTYGMSADNSGLELWEKLIRKKPNIRWVFSGHYIIPAAWAQKGLTERVIKVNDYGQIVNQIFVNYQDDLNWGDGYFMRLQFKPNEGLVNVKFWSPYFNQFDSRVPEYALSDPSVTVTNSLGVQRDISVGRDVRIAGDLKVENLTPFRLVRSDSDHVVRDAVNLVYDYDGFKVKALKDSFAIRLTLGDSAKVRTPYIQGQLADGTKTFQLRSFEPTSLYLGDSSGASAVLPSAAGMTARNTAFGYMSLARTTTGAINTAFGHLTLASNINGNFNNAFGDYALSSLTVGSDNTAIGQASMYAATNASNNTALGTNSLQFVTGNENTAIGKGAMGNVTSGSNNVAIGRSAGRDISGSNNVFVGWFAGYNAGSVSNRLYVDNNGTDGLPALLYGEFDNQLLRINGQGNFTGKLLVNSSGTADSALQVSGGVYGTAGARFPNLPSGKQAKQVFIDGNGTLYQADSTGTGGSGSMVYPGAGIAVSTGSAWGTSITDNSADWNTVTSKQNISDTSTVDATRWWVQQQGYLTSAPTPTWQQSLTAGSTLTENNTITGGGFNWTWNNSGNQTINLAASKSFIVNGNPSYVDFSIGQSSNVFTDQFIQAQGSTYSAQQQISSWSSGSILFAYAGNTVGNKSSGYELVSDSVNLYSTFPGAFTSKVVIKDTITLRPHLGNLRIDSLRTVVSTIGKKLVLHDTITGMTERVDPSLVGGGVTTVGAFSGSSQANGATISGSTITFGPADGTNPGMVSTGTQTWAGDKTFTGEIIGKGAFVGSSFAIRGENAVIGNDASTAGSIQLRNNASTAVGISGFSGGVSTGSLLFHQDGRIHLTSPNGFIFYQGATERLRMLGGFTVNEDGVDADTRIEGDTDPNLIFVDASTDRVGIGTNNPQGKLHVSAANAKIIAENPGNQFVNLFAGASVSLFSFKDKFGIQTATTLTDDGSANYAQMVFSSKNTIFGDMTFSQADDFSSRVAIMTATAARKGLVIRGASAQTATLFEAQNNAGSILASIASDGLLTISKSSGSSIQLGTNSSSATANPLYINSGGTYGSNTPGSIDNLKWRMYDDGGGSMYGIGMSAGLMEFRVGTSGDDFGWFVNTTEVARLNITGGIATYNLGVAGTTKGLLSISGNTSGTISITTQAAAGTYTLHLPTNDGDANQFLQTDGSGNLTWATASGTGTVTSVATNNGTGITGGTITVSGTLAIDTANTISTRAQLQHRIDSLAGTISGGTPGGSTKQFQYNNAGAFAGTAMLTQETDQILVTGSATGTSPFVVNGFEGSTVDIIRAEASGVKRFGVHYDGYVQMMDVTAPGTPAAGYGNLYVTTDSLRFKNDAGVEFTLGRGGSGGVADPGANGIMVRTALNTTTARTLTGTADRITVSNGDGTSGNPTIDIASTYAGQNTIATVGTITSGTWNGSAIGDAYISSAATWNAKQAAYANLTSIGSLANAAGWLYNNGSGTFSYSTPTKTDVGLSNVENTALSTWAGSANITTVGTIGTGTWQGGVIGSTYGGTGVNNGGRTLTINTNSGTIAFGAASKTMTVNNSITLAGTDATTMTFPSTSQDVVGATATQTLTNKRVTSRTGTTASTASLTIDSDATDMYTVTALAAAMTINNPSGTPTDGQKLIIRIKDNGTARGLTWSGSQFRAGDIAFPTTTVLGKTMYIGLVWNAADTKWDLLAYIDNL